MKLTKHANKNKSRIVSLATAVALILCTVLSFVLILPDRRVFAEDGASPAAKTSNGIRFVQVAAGYDFAIGLTYDRKLYGWSLLTDAEKAQVTGDSLGKYYTSIPTQIDVTFRTGPKGSYKFTETGGNENYHTPRTDDAIKSIATTGTTAAFVTEKGYIYTWGADSAQDVPQIDSNSTTHYLLMRSTATEDSQFEYKWYTPYIIDYYYYNNNHEASSGYQDGQQSNWTATEWLIPSADDAFTSLAGGEFNYIFMTEKNITFSGTTWTDTSGKDYFISYVWGSILYNAVNSENKSSYNYTNALQVQGTDKRVFSTHIISVNDGVKQTGMSAVAGGYTVGYNYNNTSATKAGGTSLQIHGKNFITTQDAIKGDGNNYTVTNITQVISSSEAPATGNITFGSATVADAIAGGRSSKADYGALYGSDGEQYYARQKNSSTGKLTYGISSAPYITDSKGESLNVVVGSFSENKNIYALPVTRNAVSLGNDIGYGVDSNGYLYGWGDNTNGQLTAGVTEKYKDLPTRLLGSAGITVTSVAAGKQKSGTDRAFHGDQDDTWKQAATTPESGEEGESEEQPIKMAFESDVKNDGKFISAALTDTGVIYAWANGLTAQPLSYTDPTGQRSEDFVAIYSGYGENLFAVTASGKLVRITVKTTEGVRAFDMYIYDEYKTLDTTGSKMENWKVDSTNSVVFTVNQQTTEVEPYLGKATFYVWSATALTRGAGDSFVDAENITINGNDTTAYKPLVSENNIGDAYRILGFGSNDGSIKYLKAADLTDCAPKYYFDGKVMSDKQRQNMFDCNVVYGGEDNEGVGIEIAPKQSSKGKNIRVDFYIARYNNYNKHSNAADGDKAIYFDYKPCSITFSIQDTPTVLTFSPYDESDMCNIPLLDPNNPYNTYFSVALQNVSSGVDELIKFLTGKTGTNEVNTDFKTAVLAEMKKDKGFPDSEKTDASKGNLSYYLNANDLGKYNNVYQFLFTDRDGDRVVLHSRGEADQNFEIITGGGVSGRITTIQISVDYKPTEYGIVSEYRAENLADASFKAGLLKALSTDFDNRYGLYGFNLTDAGKLEFKYDVLLFTATGAMDNTVAYSGNVSNPASVNGYNTKKGRAGTRANAIGFTINNYTYTDANGYVEGTESNRKNLSDIVFVYSQPTLRLKSELEDSNGGYKNGQATANGQHNNTYVETRSSALYGQGNTTLYVGDTRVIYLSDYFEKFTDSMSFTFENSESSDSLKKFSDQFPDYTGQVSLTNVTPGVRVVWLEGDKITVHPTIAAPISFTVEVQRFVDGAKNRYFKNGESVDEKIYLTFNFDSISGFYIDKTQNTPEEILVKNEITVDLFGGDGSINSGKEFFEIYSTNNAPLKGVAAASRAINALRSNATIFDINNSETSKPEDSKLFNVVYNPADKTKFKIVPLRSGSGSIQFSVNIYDQSESFVLTVNVSKEVQLSAKTNMITVVDDQYISVSTLTEALRNSNKFNADVMDGKYRILYSDVKNPDASRNEEKQYSAIYFTGANGATGYPPFIANAVFEKIESADDTTIRLIAQNDTVQRSETYYMHVRYTNADVNVTSYEGLADSQIIEVIIPVQSGKIKLQAVEGGNLSADIDCRNTNAEGNWWTTEGERLETKVTIQLSYLLDRDASLEGRDKYKIFLLSAESEAAQYFQYEKGADDRSIIITPKDNTPDPETFPGYELSVSVYSDGDSTTKVLSFLVSVKGILTTLPVTTNDEGIIGYGNIWLYSFIIVFGVLAIIFVIRFIVYIRRRSKQRAIIRRNQELIRLRDRMHGKANAASRQQLVKSKLKMEDPKYAKMFNDMRRDKEEESGISLDNSDLAATAERKTKKKKKKGGKKTVAELKAELEAKKAAFAAAQAGGAQPVNPFGEDMPPIDGDGFVAPDGGFDGGGFPPDDGGFAGGYDAQSIDGNDIVFDASDVGDGNM